MRIIMPCTIAAAMLAGCARDTVVDQDYVIYDHDGSNRTLIGADGAVTIGDVIAFRLERPFIFVAADGRRGRPCSYHMIDMRVRHLLSPEVGSRDSLAYAAKLASGAQTVMDRPCLAQAPKRAAGKA